ncbi:hypothetical protein C8A00DRAFT_19715 [Chaetomidium leptoderma]|uniref:Uncharacterized protein n=1 Tax=Chaetomidium leptoderma TaxID=669021 RepID=A0AAN6VBN8_9PEZI|nr:hypothetical protein C8A00DRAFT_19715 [Chaetomidium leptoderma]
MRFISIIVPAALSLAGSCTAWTKSAGGVWVANNNFYRIRDVWVHESCTRMNTETVLTSGACGYFYDGAGNIYNGRTYIHPPDRQYVDVLTWHFRLLPDPGPSSLPLKWVEDWIYNSSSSSSGVQCSDPVSRGPHWGTFILQPGGGGGVLCIFNSFCSRLQHLQ